MSGRQRLLLSKFLSLILRHKPKEFNIQLSSDGFVNILNVVDVASKYYRWVTPKHIEAIAFLDSRERFEIINGMVRAKYGHSIPVNIKYPEALNVQVLYHGTSEENLKNILEEGVKPRQRLYVHLTSSIEDAWINARRKGKPVVLVIDAEGMIKNKFKIFKASRNIYLTKFIPSIYIIKVLRISSYSSIYV